MFEKIRRFYEKGLWTTAMVRQAMERGLLSEAQYAEIVEPAAAGQEEAANG